MELAKAFSIHTDYRDRRTGPSWDLFLFADVIFIDKTHSAITPAVYQLNDASQLSQLNFNPGAANSWKDNCTMLGELDELDKKRKIIRLANKQSVSYKHLIIISGKKPLVSTINQEITNALQALMEALKVNPNVDSILLPSWTLRQMTNDSQATHNESANANCNVVKVTHPYFVEQDSSKTTFGLDAINERLYEIYI